MCSKVLIVLCVISIAITQPAFSTYAQSDEDIQPVQRNSEGEKFIIRYQVNSTEIEEGILGNKESLARISNYLKLPPPQVLTASESTHMLRLRDHFRPTRS